MKAAGTESGRGNYSTFQQLTRIPHRQHLDDRRARRFKQRQRRPVLGVEQSALIALEALEQRPPPRTTPGDEPIEEVSASAGITLGDRALLPELLPGRLDALEPGRFEA